MALQKLIRTALYIRVSTEEQALHGLSLEAQEAALREYASKNGLTVVGVYVDEGITARKKLSNRKELLRLLEDVKAGKIDLIIFTKIDRWMRNIYDYHKVQEVLENHNVNWKTIYENYDTSTASGRLHINIMLSVAQDEADRTSERIKAVFANKVERGEYLTNKIPFGYLVKNSKVSIDEETKHIVEDMFDHFMLSHSVRGTQFYLQDKYGITFHYTAFRNIFDNTLYCGEYRGTKDFCEPYITREQFDEIQNILKSKNVKRTPSGLTYVFSGLLICGECGRKLGSSYNERKDGIIATYRCAKKVKSGSCGFGKTIMEKTIEQYLFDNLLPELDKVKREHEINKPKKKTVVNTEKAVEKIKKKLARLKNLYVNGKIEMEEYERDYDNLHRQIDNLYAAAKEEESEIDIEAIKTLLSKQTEEIYRTLPAENKRMFWRGFIDHIVVHDRDKMDVIFLKKKTY